MSLLKLKKYVRDAREVLNQFQAIETTLYGGMHPMAAQLWAYLFAIQSANNISGDMMEIGVFKGWGSYIPARYCRANETIVLVDISKNHLDISNKFLIEKTGIASKNIHCVLADTASSFGFFNQLPSQNGFRWIHIDGEHSYSAVMRDLDTAARIASSDSIICVDDVDHTLAPCINDALRDWLNNNKQWKLLIRGYNKAYLVSDRAKLPWTQYINILPEVFKKYFSSSIILASQTQSTDTPYFSYGDPLDGKCYLRVNRAIATLDEFDGIQPRTYLVGATSKPVVLVFGNCQMNVLHGALVSAGALCGLDVRFEYVKDVHEATQEDAVRLKQIAQYASGLICQKVSGEKFAIKTSELMSCLSDEAFVITVPSMHFNAYWPNQADLQMIPGSLHCMPVDALMYKWICDGFSDLEISDKLLSFDLFDPVDVRNWYQAAIERLRNRELEDDLTVKISSFLEDSASTERLFYIFNHPKKKVLDYVLQSVLKNIYTYFEARDLAIYTKIVSGEYEVQYDMSMIDFVEFPPLCSVAHGLGLSLAESNDVYRFSRTRGSRDIHLSVSINKEIKFIKDRLPLLSDTQRYFNISTIENTTLLPREPLHKSGS